MSFTRQTTTKINFDESTITNSNEYLDFVEINPTLKDSIDNLTTQFVKWAKNPPCKKDYCYLPKKSLPYKDSWSVDEDECTDWYEFQEQMGTTRDKFELQNTTITDKTSLLIGEVFEKIGFKVFVVTFSHWRVGYDFDFAKLSDAKGDIRYPNKNDKYNDIHSVHICVSI